jgi:hypothetical protein
MDPVRLGFGGAYQAKTYGATHAASGKAGKGRILGSEWEAGTDVERLERKFPFGLSLSKPCTFLKGQPFDKLRVNGKKDGTAVRHPHCARCSII